MSDYDFLVIGSGIAGLTYTLKVAQHFPDSKVAVVTKSDENESNTKYAQGGIAAVTEIIADSYEQHIQDTLIAGDGLCEPSIVKLVVTEGPERIRELVEWGIKFDKTSEGTFDLGLEGGHSKKRILHHKDVTGLEIERNLIRQIHKQSNVIVLSQHFAIDLITQHHLNLPKAIAKKDLQCYGAYVLNESTNKIETITAGTTLLASGGVGQIYQNSTNPIIATGDGIAMAYRARVVIKNLEFIQFHPTAMYQSNSSPSFLISEAVRGYGAILRDKSGNQFMENYDDRKELASRDIVSRAIDSELKKSGEDHVYLDCRHLNIAEFNKHFPNISNKMAEMNIDLQKDMIPVVPAAHYLCGGIAVNEFGQTSLKNLLACGECACTGLHGANRLASNSLLEAVVFAHRCYLKAVELSAKTRSDQQIPKWDDTDTVSAEELVLISHNRKELQAFMSDYVGIIKTDQRLYRAQRRLKVLYEETEELYRRTQISSQLLELRNMITVSYLMVQQCLSRKENRGVFFKH